MKAINMRIIMLVDMDYFYAACEELRRPELKGKPLVVGADPKNGAGRGVVYTCNYEARKYGLKSGMPISMAYRIKPDAFYVLPDFEYYEEMSKKVMEIIKENADKFEQVSIDEAFVDVSKRADGEKGALALAKIVKNKVKDTLNLPCSVGIGPNKLIAKMACNAAKPNGIMYVSENEAKKFIEEMPVNDMYGVGKKTAEKLASMGYATIGQLANANLMSIMDAFGAYGIELHKNANAIDESEVQENYEVKSIGRERTFYENTADTGQIIKTLREIGKEVHDEVEKSGFAFRVVTVKIRYSNFEEHMKSKSLARASDSQDDIINTAIVLFSKYYENGEFVRKVGIRVSNLTNYKGQKKIGQFEK